jgi:hypothetical protein
MTILEKNTCSRCGQHIRSEWCSDGLGTEHWYCPACKAEKVFGFKSFIQLVLIKHGDQLSENTKNELKALDLLREI